MMNKKLKKELEEYLGLRYSTETVKTYQYRIDKFLAEYPNPKKVKLKDIEAYMLSLKTNGGSVGHRTISVASIKVLFEFLVEKEIITEHPCKSFRISEKKITGKNFNKLFTLVELQMMLSHVIARYRHITERNLALISILIYQGLTSKELVNMRVSDIDFSEEYIVVKGGNRNKARKIGFFRKQYPILRDYIENHRNALVTTKTDRLFVNKLGVPMSVDGVHSVIKNLDWTMGGKEFSPKNIRNSVISYWLNDKQLPIEEVQKMAGHSYPSSTQKYIREDMDTMKEGVNRLHDSIFN